MTLSGISTQGHKTSLHWVKSYEILYSVDGLNYDSYKEVGLSKVRQIVLNLFDKEYKKHKLMTSYTIIST